jgi:plasmid stabilization system protein ParE
MAKRAIVWTVTAAKQRREVLRYWSIRNNSTLFAEKLIKLIARQLRIIERFPESFVQSEYPNTRVAAMGYFSIYYRFTDTHLIVMAFWDTRQDPQRLMRILDSTPL